MYAEFCAKPLVIIWKTLPLKTELPPLSPPLTGEMLHYILYTEISQTWELNSQFPYLGKMVFILRWCADVSIGLEYQVFLNFYVIYRSTVICKLSLHIFGNLIAHWLLSSQGSFTPDARVSWGVFFVLEWVWTEEWMAVCLWLLAEGIPTDEINQWNG